MIDPDAAPLIDALMVALFPFRQEAMIEVATFTQCIQYLMQARQQHPDLPPFEIWQKMAQLGLVT